MGDRETAADDGPHRRACAPGEVGAQFGSAFRELPAAVQATLEAYRSGATTMLPGETARVRMPFQGDTELVTSRGMTNKPVTWAEVKGMLTPWCRECAMASKRQAVS